MSLRDQANLVAQSFIDDDKQGRRQAFANDWLRRLGFDRDNLTEDSPAYDLFWLLVSHYDMTILAMVMSRVMPHEDTTAGVD
jgi:hypothetical protein